MFHCVSQVVDLLVLSLILNQVRTFGLRFCHRPVTAVC